MKTKLFTAGFIAALAVISFYSFKPSDGSGYSYMEINTIESIIPGGLGRSKMLVTESTGKQSDAKIENLYSLIGINFSNIQSNDNAVMNKINSLAKDGWTLDQVVTGVQSPNKDEGGIFLTRYILKRPN